jgi:FMN phosphatase YigB (HAD superfamily)
MTQSREKWVLFDFGGVLLTMNDKQHYQSLMTSVMDAIGFPVADVGLFKKRVYGGPEFASAKVGAITSTEMWRRIFADADLLPEQREALKASSSSEMGDVEIAAPRRHNGEFSVADVERMRDHVRLHGRHVHPALVDYISQLKSRGVRVAVLSNYESDLLQVLEGLGVRDLFGDEMIVSSHDLRAAKPKRESFFRALKRLQITPTPLLDCPHERDQRPATQCSSSSVATTPLDVTSLSTPSIAADDWSPDTPSCALSPFSAPGHCHDVVPDEFVEGFFPNVIFVDDKESNVEGAKRCGVPRSIVYKTLTQCIQDIEEQLTAMDRL